MDKSEYAQECYVLPKAQIVQTLTTVEHPQFGDCTYDNARNRKTSSKPTRPQPGPPSFNQDCFTCTIFLFFLADILALTQLSP